MGKLLTAFFEWIGDGAKGAEGEEDEGCDDEWEGVEGGSETGWSAEEHDGSVSNEEGLEEYQGQDDVGIECSEDELDGGVSKSENARRLAHWQRNCALTAVAAAANKTKKRGKNDHVSRSPYRTPEGPKNGWRDV